MTRRDDVGILDPDRLLREWRCLCPHAVQAELGEMAVVRRRDELRIARVLASDAQGFWNLVQENRDDDLKWCGSSVIYSFMKAVPQARGTLQRYEQWNIDGQSVLHSPESPFSD